MITIAALIIAYKARDNSLSTDILNNVWMTAIADFMIAFMLFLLAVVYVTL